MDRLTATADVLPAARADALLADYERIGQLKAEAERLLASARATYDTERAKGALDGQRTGAMQALRLLAEAEEAVRTLITSLESEIALLAVAIAERILGEFDQQELVLRAARHAIADLREDDAATLHVAPRYVGALRQRLEAEAGLSLAVEPDPAMAPQGCRISTERGVIDVGIRSQLEVVRQTVRSWARSGGEA